MIGNGASRIALRCGIGTLLSAASASAWAQSAFDEIIVTATKGADNPTLIAPDAASLLATPGDVNDPLKALLSLPSITFGGGDLDDPIIRSGAPDSNLFLIDGVPVENVFHELSDSIVSPNIIRSFDLHAAAYSPEYGGAVGGVIDIGLRDPSASTRNIKLDLSQLKSGVLVETPITDNIAAYGAYRHNLAHFFLEDFERGNDVLVFQMPKSRDYAGRIIWRSDNTDITASAFGSWDLTEEVAQNEELSNILGEEETQRFDAQSIRIRSTLSASTNIIATLSHSMINENRRENNGALAERNATVTALRSKVLHHIGDHQIFVGANYSHADNELDFRGFLPICGRFEQNCGAAFSAGPISFDETFQTTEIYAGGAFALTDRLSADIGLHNAIDHFLDEIFIEPRIGISYQLNDNINVLRPSRTSSCCAGAPRTIKSQSFRRSSGKRTLNARALRTTLGYLRQLATTNRSLVQRLRSHGINRHSSRTQHNR